jgi:hypothetical protein
MIGAVALLAGAFAVHSQGTVAFGNYLALNSYIYVSFSGILLGGASNTTTGFPYADTGNGNDWSVTLYGSAGTNVPAYSLQQLNLDGTFNTPVTATLEDGDAPPGLWVSYAVADIPGTTEANQPATIQVRAWYNGGGAYPTYNSAVSAGVPSGESATGNIVTGGDLPTGFPMFPASLPPLGNIAVIDEGGPLGGVPGSGDGFDYIVTGSNVILTGYTGTNQVVTVPAKINNMPVVSTSRTGYVGHDYEGTFWEGKMTSVIISPGVLVIGVNTFGGCGNLTNVVIPNSVVYVDPSAFSFCTSLSNIYFLGNAPAGNSSVDDYDGATPTVYILPGTIGWDTFATNTGISPVMWNPRIDVSGSAFGVRNNQFGFNVVGTNDFTVVVEAATNLENPEWTPLQTFTLTNGQYFFSDATWTNYSSRFYRLGVP